MKSKIRIIVMFTVIFAMSFIPDMNKELFDWKCQGSGKLIVIKYPAPVMFGCPYFDMIWFVVIYHRLFYLT